MKVKLYIPLFPSFVLWVSELFDILKLNGNSHVPCFFRELNSLIQGCIFYLLSNCLFTQAKSCNTKITQSCQKTVHICYIWAHTILHTLKHNCFHFSLPCVYTACLGWEEPTCFCIYRKHISISPGESYMRDGLVKVIQENRQI